MRRFWMGMLVMSLVLFAAPVLHQPDAASANGCTTLHSGSFSGGASALSPAYTLSAGQTVTVTASHSAPGARVEADVRHIASGTYAAYQQGTGSVQVTVTVSTSGDYDSFFRDDGTAGTVQWSIRVGQCTGDAAQSSGGDAVDSDGDGVLDGGDNCPTVANPDQADTWGVFGTGDACETHYNWYFQVQAFPVGDTMHVYSNCSGDQCQLVGIVDIAALGGSAPGRAALSSGRGSGGRRAGMTMGEAAGWYVQPVLATPDYGPSADVKVYIVYVYAPGGELVDNRLEILVYPDGSFDWRTATWR